MLGLLLGGCVVSGSDGKAGTAATTTVSRPGPGSESGPVQQTVDALGVRFDLPVSFRVADDEEFAFLARSFVPQAVFSIEHGDPSDLDRPRRAGEERRSMKVGDIDAVEVTHAAVPGLPAGIVANELLVDNGSRSFSVIMSAPTDDLTPMWKTFVESVEVEPA